MKYTNLQGYKTIKEYVDYKLSFLKDKELDFKDLYTLMFDNGANIMFESSRGVRIEKVTYLEAKQKADSYAYNIQKKLEGKHKGQAIGLYLENSDTWLEMFWAILKAGYCPLLLNLRLSNEILNNALKSLDAVMVIGENCHLDLPIYAPRDLSEKGEDIGDKDFANTIYVMSSGTSNSIKLCAYTGKEFFNIVKQAEYVINSNPIVKKHYNGELKLLTFLPFYHIFGLVAVYTWFAYFSRTFVKLNDLAPQTIQNTIKRHHVTHIFAVPLFWQKTYESVIKVVKGRGDKTYNKFLEGMKIASKIGDTPIIGKLFIKLAFKEIRENLFGDSPYFMITGGSHIDSRVITFFNNIGYHLANGYGMSEVGITSVELSNKHSLLNSCSIGKPLPGVEYQINENGELLIKSHSSANYVLENGQKTQVADTWFNSHDLASFENGVYHLLGRNDDLVVSITGENLNPNIIEEALYVDGVNDICLIKNQESQIPVLLVSVNRFSKKEKVEEISLKIKELISKNNLDSQIGKIDFVTTSFISENDFKKNRKRIAKEYFNGDMLRYSFENNEQEDELNIKVKEYFANALSKKSEEIPLDADFFLDEGGTSLDYFALIEMLQHDFGVDLVPSEENKLHTVREISDELRRKL